jgi:hypothetical protein
MINSALKRPVFSLITDMTHSQYLHRLIMGFNFSKLHQIMFLNAFQFRQMTDSGYRRRIHIEGMNQSQRDQAETERRMHKCGPLFAVMDDRLRPFPKETLMDAALALCQARGIRKPDRICGRGRVCLICFFCDHFPDFPAGFPALSPIKPDPVPIQKKVLPPIPKRQTDPGTPDPDLVGALGPKAGDGLATDICWDGHGDFPNFFRDVE